VKQNSFASTSFQSTNSDLKCFKIIGGRAPPRTQLRELTMLPQTLYVKSVSGAWLPEKVNGEEKERRRDEKWIREKR
jgi:hypothetical protein